MNCYQQLIKPLLFTLDAERAHHLALRIGSLAKFQPFSSIIESLFRFDEPRLEQECFGLKFKNPIGLSAGADKNCQASELFTALGFGFLESVSFTYLAQPGNPPPRIFRLSEDEALINRLGFPSIGAQALVPKIIKARQFAHSKRTVFAANFAKSKSVAIENAVDDYLNSFRLMRDIVDYVTINVSSPNTPGLRDLQAKSHLGEILTRLQQENSRPVPLLVKIAPDLTLQQIDEIIDTCLQFNVKGIVATNSTIARESIQSKLQSEIGGLSGKPLFSKSLPIVRHIRRQAKDKLCIIGVGGISSAEDAIAMFEAGASLIEIYTALIYQGPTLIKKIKQGICQHLDTVGASHLRDIIGQAAPQ